MTPEHGISASIAEQRNDSPATLEAWMKPEIVSFTPASEAQGPPSSGGTEGFSNIS
jgi:hypothetical protein